MDDYTPAEKDLIEEFIAAACAGDTNPQRSLTSYLNYGKDGPPVGSKVVTLRGGFGSRHGGQELYVIAIGRKGEPSPGGGTWVNEYVALAARPDTTNAQWLAPLESWWHDIAVIANT